ncbi:hypothetical protein V8G54_014798, partial [Vigna mungo]
ECNRRKLTCLNFPNISCISPPNWFLLKSKKVKLVKFRRDSGISLEKVLFPKYNAFSREMDPISTGIPPVNLLLERFRLLKFLQLATPLGASPTNPFCERSSSSRLQFKGKASKGIVPLR